MLVLLAQEYTRQKDYKNLSFAFFDVWWPVPPRESSTQKSNRRETALLPQRDRYHCGVMDMDVLRQERGFDKLPEHRVIFIMRGYVLRHGLPIHLYSQENRLAGRRVSER